MLGICMFLGAPMGAINLFSHRAVPLCLETPGISGALCGQLPKFTPSPDFVASFQHVEGANYSPFIGSQVLAGPARCKKTLFILTYLLLIIAERWGISKTESVVSSYCPSMFIY